LNKKEKESLPTNASIEDSSYAKIYSGIKRVIFCDGKLVNVYVSQPSKTIEMAKSNS
jgi:hypothetical protein